MQRKVIHATTHLKISQHRLVYSRKMKFKPKRHHIPTRAVRKRNSSRQMDRLNLRPWSTLVAEVNLFQPQLCRADYRIALCKIFMSSSMEDRIKRIKRHGCCIRCLSKGHVLRDCLSKKLFNMDKCTALHHPLLHDASRSFKFLKHEMMLLKHKPSA